MPIEDPIAEVKSLLSTHAEYQQEVDWHKFLLDAYSGTGGFQGRVRQPESTYWGPAAAMYFPGSVGGAAVFGGSGSLSTSYLDQYPREDEPKFAARVKLAHYPNYVQPIVDIRVSYLVRKNPSREGVGARADEWRKGDVDGAGNDWETFVEHCVTPRAAILGWTPVLFDMPRSSGEQTMAQADASGLNKVRAIPLFPSNLLDYSADEAGQLLWAKIRVDTLERPNALGPSRRLARITIWTREDAQIYDVVSDDDSGEPKTVVNRDVVKHSFGRVPLISFRHKTVPDDPLRGLPLAGSISQENRRLFNLVSELDEHMRAQVFALLVVPTDDPSKLGALAVGTSNALPIPTQSPRGYEYVAPPASVATTYENRIAATISEIYRMARTETSTGSQNAGAESGVARAYAFEQTNRAIADFAAEVARSEQDALRLVSVALGDGTVDDIRVIPAKRFDVEEMLTEIKQATDAVNLGLGPTATARIKRRIVDLLLPNLSEDDEAIIDEEIDDITKAEADASVLARDALKAAQGGDDEDVEDEEVLDDDTASTKTEGEAVRDRNRRGEV